MTALAAAARGILEEIGGVADRMPGDAMRPLADALLAARRIALHGAGRTGLIMQALAMRLYHLGLDAHVVGAMNAPPVGAGDLLAVNAATGDLATGIALLDRARAAGARTAVITARPDGPASARADLVLHIPAQVMGMPATSRLPLGSQYELALFVLSELLVLDLARRLGRSFDDLAARHSNLA